MKELIFPARLKKGDTVALLSASGPCDVSRIPAAVRAVQHMGLECLVMESCTSQSAYLAGGDSLRAADLHFAFSCSDIRGIFLARGGYGAQRLLPLTDFEMIRANPKIFAGYSDGTALHTVFNQFCGFITFHAPMPVSDLYKNTDEFTGRSLNEALFAKQRCLVNPENQPLVCLRPGKARGPLTGGNVSLLASSLGTAYEIDTAGKIIFLEEINEEPYKIDRMLLQLKLAGKFRDSTGVLLGSFNPLTLPDIKMAVEDLILTENKPVLANLACGHGLPSLTLPLGARVYMDAGAKKITFA
jgi:muramoyltetrapeptide carboxypeptidase